MLDKMTIHINDDNWVVEKTTCLEETCYGLTAASNFTIFLNKDMHRQHIQPTIVHELTHAFLRSYGFKLKYDEPAMTEEQVAEFVGKYAHKIIHFTNFIISVLYKSEDDC